MSLCHETIDDLALFGGRTAFAEKLHVGRPNIGNRERLLERINSVLDSRRLTNGGAQVREFEQRVADWAGVRYCVAACNGTLALEVAVRALGLTGEVIVPSFTFVATAHALQWQGITPVFCDIDPQTHNIDPARIEASITPQTTGIVGVHLWGRPCDIDRLEHIARRYRLRLLFDAAHAFACSYRGRRIGSFGDAEVYSFHATKFVNTLEGGAVVTNDSDLAAKMRLMINFGFAGYDNVVCLGTNGKMNELCAAVGLTTLESLDEFIALNRRNYECYRSGLADLPGVDLVTYDEARSPNYQYIVVRVDAARTGLSRDELVRILHAENIMARRYFHPGCHRMEPYRSDSKRKTLFLPHTEALSESILVLPGGTSVDPDAVASICRILQLVMREHREVRRRLDPGNADAGPVSTDGGCGRTRHAQRREQAVKVSALMTTFNHERFVAQAIEGFLMQEADFPCELVIADDCSTDATRDVIRRYWERHRDRIRVLLNRRNIGARRTFVRAYHACHGQYIATLDGDDCWTSARKLQRQADLLDHHPEYALCFHSATLTWDDSGREPTVYRPSRVQEVYRLDDLFEYNFIASCSAMYRKGVLDEYPIWHFVMPVGDWAQHVLHAQHGLIGYIDEPMGIYRQHPGGVYSMKAATHKLRVAIEALRRFRCVMARRHRGIINRSLCRHYCRLARQYREEGRLVEARRCIKECISEICPDLRLPIRDLLSATWRVFTPSPPGGADDGM